MAARLQLEQMRASARPAVGPTGMIPGMPGQQQDGRTGQYL